MRKKIKILFRHRSMEMGGVEKVLLSILNNLDQKKFDCTVLLNLDQGELRNEFPSHVKKIVLAKGKEEMPQNTFLQKIALLKRRALLKKMTPSFIDKEILKESFDIEIAMDWRDFSAVLNSTNKNSKKIGWFHSEIQVPKLQPLVPMILEAFPKFDTMVYCSEKIKTLMHQHHPNLNYPLEKVIINAIPTKEIREKALITPQDSPIKNDTLTFVSIGRLHTRKGYHQLMKAHAKLINEGHPHQVVILGDGEEKENLQNQINKLGVGDSFILLGNRMNPYAYLSQADFFILPSESEAWPLVLAEALLLKKPTIATDTGDVSTVLEHNKTGLLINYDVDEMYHAMKRFITEPELIEKFNQHLENIDDKFDNQKIFNEIEETILNTLNS